MNVVVGIAVNAVVNTPVPTVERIDPVATAPDTGNGSSRPNWKRYPSRA